MAINANNSSLLEFYKIFWNIVLGDMGPVCRKVLYGYLALVILILIFGKKEARKFFGISAAILLVVCLNPFSVYYISKYADLSTRYFRFLWLPPAALTYGYAFAAAVNLIRQKRVSALLAYAVSVVILVYSVKPLTSVTSRLYTGVSPNPGMQMIDNVYKVENDTLQICNIIEKDKGDPAVTVKALYGYEVFLDIRTYDASIYSGLSLKKQNKYRSRKLREKRLNKMSGNKKYKKLLNYLINAQDPDREIRFDPDKIAEALEEKAYQYVIVQTDRYVMPWFEACGTIIGVTDHYTVIKVGKQNSLM